MRGAGDGIIDARVRVCVRVRVCNHSRERRVVDMTAEASRSGVDARDGVSTAFDCVARRRSKSLKPRKYRRLPVITNGMI